MKLAIVDANGFVVNVVLGDLFKYEAPEGQQAVELPLNSTCGIGWKWNAEHNAFEEVE